MITKFKIKQSNIDGLKVLEIKYKEDTLVNWSEANEYVANLLEKVGLLIVIIKTTTQMKQ